MLTPRYGIHGLKSGALRCTFSAFCLLLASVAVAQTVRMAPADPVADRLVAEALRSAPEIVEARAALEAARRRIEPARTLPDPSASFVYQNDGRSLSLGHAEGSFIGLMLSQPLPWPGKLALAGRANASEPREIELGTWSRTGLTIEARIRNALYDLVMARALDRLIEERRTTAQQVESAARNRYVAGLAVQQDVLGAQIELARIDEVKAAQRAVIAGRLAELDGLLGRAALDETRLYKMFVLRHPRMVIGTAVLIVVCTIPVYRKLGHEFMPPLNEGSILYMPSTLPGISVAQAEALLQRQDQLLKEFPEVERVFGKAGRAETSTDPAPLSMMETILVLKPTAEWRTKPRWYSHWLGFLKPVFSSALAGDDLVG